MRAPIRAASSQGDRYKGILLGAGPALAYIYAREKPSDAEIAHVLTTDEARRIAVNVARPLVAVLRESTNPNVSREWLLRMMVEVDLS
jgi:hypothetical protein